MKYRSGDHIVTVVVPATELPVSLYVMKEHLSIVDDNDVDDALIYSYIEAATEMLGLNGELGRTLVTQTVDESFSIATRDVYLTALPVQALESVKFYDDSNIEQTATLSDFTLYKSDDWAFVRSENWPTAYDRPDAITVRYTSGHPLESTPTNITHAIKMIVAHWYLNREGTSDLNLREIPMAASHLIGLSRRGWYG